jgi:hypothetical protein
VQDEAVVTTAATASFEGASVQSLVAREGAEVTVAGGSVARLALFGTATRQPTVTVVGATVGETDNGSAYPGTVVVK